MCVGSLTVLLARASHPLLSGQDYQSYLETRLVRRAMSEYLSLFRNVNVAVMLLIAYRF